MSSLSKKDYLDYINTVHSNSNSSLSFVEFSSIAMPIIKSLPTTFIDSSPIERFTTLLDMYKSGDIDINIIHYIVDNDTFFTGFKEYYLASLAKESDMLKGRTKAPKSILKFSDLDYLVAARLDSTTTENNM